jgi:hypothetical protein
MRGGASAAPVVQFRQAFHMMSTMGLLPSSVFCFLTPDFSIVLEKDFSLAQNKHASLFDTHVSFAYDPRFRVFTRPALSIL